jgi:hypothetical protein
MKLVLKVALGIICAGGVLFFASVACIDTALKESPVQKHSSDVKEKTSTTTSDIDKMKVTDLKESTNEIKFNVTNQLDHKVDYLQVTFKYYNKEGVMVYDTFTNQTDLEAGKTYRFQIDKPYDEPYEKYEYELSFDAL